MADPNQYDLLNQIQYFVMDPSSPLMQQVRKELAPLEQRAGKFKKGSPEFKKINEEYQRKAAASLLSKIQEKFGGTIPDRKAVEEQDFQRRSAEVGADPEQLKQDSIQTPYQRGFNILEQLQKIAAPTPATKASTTAPVKPPVAPPQMPGGPAPKPAMPAPAPMPSRQPGGKPPANDDEMLNETQLAMLYGLAQQASGFKNTPQTLDEIDSPDTGPRLPSAPASPEVPPRAPQDATPEQMQMEAYKKAFLGHQTGDSATYAQTPLPPGWVRSPQGLPITAPDQAQSGQNQEDVMEQIRRNIARMMAQEKMGE